MATRKRIRLTDTGIARLRPQAREYTVWDSRVPGLGVRVRPGGGKSYVLIRTVEERTRRVSLGPAASKGIDEVRHECLVTKANTAVSNSKEAARTTPSFADFVAGQWHAAHFERCKPSTRKCMRSALKTQLLPAFGTTRLDRISRNHVERWFDGYSRTAPTRFLSREEIRRLHDALDAASRRGPSQRQQADIIRLLMLTGSRRGEIVTLRWSEVEGDTLALADSKTGPRKVHLNLQARAVLDRQPRGTGPWVFPSPLGPDRHRCGELGIWPRVRREAGIEDVRLHDLRHNYASYAVMQGIPVPVVSRLLGHSSVRVTLRYVHLGDREVRAAAERIGKAMAKLMAGTSA